MTKLLISLHDHITISIFHHEKEKKEIDSLNFKKDKKTANIL